ncbi:MAG: hypothetical protein PVJ67_04200 [Candidatus Pacearchaeota archaeon]
MKNKLKTFKNNLKDKFGLRDFIILLGMGVLFYGIWLIYPPAAYIASGIGFIYLGVR